jgi:pyridoxine 4-dehydrogenase
MATSNDFAHAPHTIKLGTHEVARMGFGAMRLPGKDVWGEPDDPDRAKRVLRRAVDLGVNLIDTAWYYGPHVANRLIAEALHPYPRGLVIATKLGGMRTPDKGWGPFAKPDQLREGLEHDLRTLKLERIDVVHLRYTGVWSGVPFLESLDALIAEQKKGRIQHLGLSNVSPTQVASALERTPIVSVQNLYTVGGGGGEMAKQTHAEVEDPEGVLELCTKRGIAFLPFFPLAVGGVGAKPAVASIAKAHGASPSQVALAWLLARSPVMLPIPGTSSVEHLEENWAARKLSLMPAEIDTLGQA